MLASIGMIIKRKEKKGNLINIVIKKLYVNENEYDFFQPVLSVIKHYQFPPLLFSLFYLQNPVKCSWSTDEIAPL